MKAVLLGIAGSYNAFSLSLYNLKAYAYTDPAIVERWDLQVIQHRLIDTATEDSAEIALLAERVVREGPDLLALSCYMWNINALTELARIVRGRLPQVRIVWGGPEMTTDYVREGKWDHLEMDYCVSGEGEQTFLELLRHLTQGRPDLKAIAGLSFRHPREPFQINEKRHPFQSLLEIPSPYLTGIVDDEVLTRPGVEANIETQRGCTLRCSYCIYHKDMDRIAYADVDRTIAEVAYALARGVKRVRFVDANFSSDLDHAKRVMKGLIERRFETRLMFELIPGFIDEELAALFGEFNALHEWNEVTLGVGVQTTNFAVLKKMRRGIKIDRFEKTFQLIEKYRIFAKIDLMIGLPGEDIKSIENTLEFMVDKLRNSQSHLLCCHVTRGLPGTELLQIARDHGMVFSSRYEPHELVESPVLPRRDMVKTLRRTAVLFRLINHGGWADREFVSGLKNGGEANIRDAFFGTRDRLGLSNIQLVDLMVEGLMEHLRDRDSFFVQEDFPYAETWWWKYSKMEVSNDWIVEFLTGIEWSGNRTAPDLLPPPHPKERVRLDVL